MAFPRNIAEMLKKHPRLAEGRDFTLRYSCQGSKFHSPTPLVVRRVTINSRSIFLCGTCQDNVQLLLDLGSVEDSPLPWVVLREFGTKIRDLVRERITNG